MNFPGKARSYLQLKKLGNILLTEREVDIISCIAQGRTSTKSIASFLDTTHKPVSYRTVGHHINNIIQKINGTSRVNIIDLVERLGQIDLFRTHYEVIKIEHILYEIIKHLHETTPPPTKIHVYFDKGETFWLKQNLEEVIQYFNHQGLMTILKIHSKGSHLPGSNSNDRDDDENDVPISNEVPDSTHINISFPERLIDYDVYTLSLSLLKHLCKDSSLIHRLQDQLKKIHMQSDKDNIRNIQDKSDTESRTIYNYLTAKKRKFLATSLIVLCSSIIGFYSMLNNYFWQATAPPIVWNIPKQNIQFIGRKSILDKIHHQFNPKRHSKKKQKNTIEISACAGLGGIGKTQLAIHYSKHTKHPYTLKAWFPAENATHLRMKYIEFAEVLGFKDACSASDTDVKKYVKEWLIQHPGWLLIFDNTESYKDIEDFLPECGGHILITTRIQHWPSTIDVMQVEVMPEMEAIQMLTSLIKRETSHQLADAEVLVQKLGCLPLAIAQAGAYIAQNNMSIRQYLELYQQHEFELLSENVFPDGIKMLPVSITWNICLERIVKELQTNQEPLLAIELLTVCAFLSPDKIKYSILMAWLAIAYPNMQSAELVLNKHLRLLQKYSMINYTEDYISIHRLIQTVVQRSLQNGISTQHQFCSSINLDWFETLLQFFIENENEFKMTNSFEQLLKIRDHFKEGLLMDYSETLAELDLSIAPVYFFQERYDKYFNLLNEVDQFLSQKHIPYLKCKLLYLYSAYYRRQGQYKIAKENIDDAIKLVKEMFIPRRDNKKIANLYSVILFNKANLIFAENFVLPTGNRNMNELNQGIIIIREAINEAKKTKNTRAYLRSVELYGRLEVLRNNPKIVISFFDKIFNKVETVGDDRTRMLYYMTYADAYKLNADYEKALRSLEKALNLAISLNLQGDIQKLKNKITALRKIKLESEQVKQLAPPFLKLVQTNVLRVAIPPELMWVVYALKFSLAHIILTVLDY
jgi:DNA-binding CsgD family transcriptional regulator/tetratricopeptide (TPR) repeat protein